MSGSLDSMFWVVFFTVEFLAAVASIVVGNYGVCLPLMQVCAFYFCVKTSPWKVAPWLLIFGGLLDAVWLHAFPTQLASMGVVILFTAWWRRFGDLFSWAAVCGAALFCGLCAWCAQWVTSSGGKPFAFRGWMSLCVQVFVSLVMTVILVAVMDRVLARRVSPGLHDEGEEE